MDGLSVGTLIEVGKYFGLPGIILVIWYLSSRDNNKLLRSYREDTKEILARYKDDVEATKRMYENNVELVKIGLALQKDLKEIVMLNTQKWQQAHDAIATQQFCPVSRERTRGG
jgi:hypothetical protein